tara:strand:+ start:1690 stop:2034 length:345 start_codon:yes stop_codon:yes gene_type:complete
MADIKHTQWFDFETEPPEKKGIYLWANNNWRSKSLSGNPVLAYEVRIARYGADKQWRDSDRNCIHSPDQWSHIPMPNQADKPDISPKQKRINLLLEDKDRLDREIKSLQNEADV